MTIVSFTLSKIDGSMIKLLYQTFDTEHSQLWIKGIEYFIDNKQILEDYDRVYNFKDYRIELNQNINNCNLIINNLNDLYQLKIPSINIDNLQNDINYIHTYFVNNQDKNNKIWSDLNSYLHGIEIIERSKLKKLQGQIFYNLPNPLLFDIPNDSYKFFTTRKKFGYCYANYPHIGRHILEMFNAQDEEASDDHIIPMNKIGGGSHFWFGNNTSYIFDIKKKLQIRNWFYKNRINEIVKMDWGNPKLAIGWLPVASLCVDISKENLVGLNRLEEIKILTA